MRIKKQRNFRKASILTVAAFVLLACGLYLALLLAAPQLAHFNKSPATKALESPPSQNRIIIPKIQADLPYKAGGPEVLNSMVWHRHPERGDPEKGGNFILSGHRLEIGLTPGETIRKSPFYNLGSLAVGDEIFVDYNGKRYAYTVTERFTVKPTQTEIEAPSDDAKLTLYTCTLGGATDGREVLIAKIK